LSLQPKARGPPEGHHVTVARIQAWGLALLVHMQLVGGKGNMLTEPNQESVWKKIFTLETSASLLMPPLMAGTVDSSQDEYEDDVCLGTVPQGSKLLRIHCFLKVKI
jgi:hypothetical protein